LDKYIANPTNTINILKKYSFVFQKKFGQNFLIDTHVLDKIIRAADITKDDVVLEIGPGIGSMTQYLLENAKRVISVEIDKKLIPILNDTLSGYDNLTLINDDILKLDLHSILEELDVHSPIKVVANLPYYITTPIIMGLFENNINIDSITVMIQKEVADRIKAKPSSKDYGALSLAVQYYSSPKVVAIVPPNCFMPRPNVSSAVINLKKHTNPPVVLSNEKLMFDLIHASFNQRRKTLVNSLNNAKNLSFSKDTILDALDKLDLSPTIRGEALSLEQFAKLSDILNNNK